MAELFKDITTYNHSLRLILSGDQHIYAHYSAATGTSDGGNNGACPELIISGGGGAFTHSTMHLASTLTHLDLPGCGIHFEASLSLQTGLDRTAL
ncbi:hypothetical protein BASA81_010163 [Batrachochytrium salamandrivorans]|nr:hypothetical protein BASA81_010163 [Batrachochytrium salamandrivorans]